MKVMGQELTGKLGTPAEYAAAYAELIKIGTDLEALNRANHEGLEKKLITKCKSFRTEAALDRFIEKLYDKDNFWQILGYRK